jgi:hypothetical protein
MRVSNVRIEKPRPSRRAFRLESAFLGFRDFFRSLRSPAFAGCQLRDLAPAFRRHGDQAALSTDPASPTAQFGHDQGNHVGCWASFNRGESFIENAPGILGNVQILYPLWHALSVAQSGSHRQRGGISN